MDTLGLSSLQAPARADLRQGAPTAAPATAATQAVRTDVPNPVTEVSRSAEAENARRLRESDKVAGNSPTDPPFREELFPEVFPEPLPADLSAAERSQIYAQAFAGESAISADQRDSAAKRLFLTTANLFRG